MKKGFTLIELLVVIAIIGILSSVVLTQLGNARKKGADAGIMANIGSMRTQFEIEYDSTKANVYGNTAAGCTSLKAFTSTTVYSSALDRIKGLSSGTITDSNAASDKMFCFVGPSSWVVGAMLPTSSNWYCADSSGKSSNGATIPATTGCAN